MASLKNMFVNVEFGPEIVKAIEEAGKAINAASGSTQTFAEWIKRYQQNPEGFNRNRYFRHGEEQELPRYWDEAPEETESDNESEEGDKGIWVNL